MQNKLIEIIKRYLKSPRKLIRTLGDKKFFNWLPDKVYLKLVYWGETGRSLNLKNPKTFNEKLQWLKLNDRKQEYTKYVDKYEVRSYIKETIGEEYLIPLLGVYNSVDEIDWSYLPEKFVLKCTHGSGCNIICTDKKKLDIEKAKKKLSKWMKKNWYWFGREWVYKDIKPHIICEKYMVDESGTELKDYKFMCFFGKVKCIFACSRRNSEAGLNINIYDKDWNLIPVRRNNKNNGQEIVRPMNYEEMLRFAETLSKNIPFVRVDFYEANEQLYFGELTFYPGSGFEEFIPETYDFLLGEWISLPIKINS